MTTERMDIGKILADVGMPIDEESRNRIDPKVMTAIMAMAQVGQLNKMRRMQEDATSQGWIRGINSPVTDVQTPPDGFKLDFNAMACYVHNDGPAIVYFAINNYNNPSALSVNETLNLEFGSHKIERFFMKCDNGQNANVRITLKG